MERKIPRKNYIILAVTIILTVLLVFYLRGWYVTTKDYYAQNSVIKDVVREIKEDEISNYTLESGKFALYVSSGQNTSVKDFENEFKKLIAKSNCQNNVLYLNTDGIDVKNLNDSLRDNFAKNDRVKNSISDNSMATLYLFEEGKISSVINNVDNYSVKSINKIIKKWGLSDNA